MPNGRRWNCIAGGSDPIPVAAAGTTVVLLKRCCGSREPAARGATCRRCSAPGTRSSSDTGIGSRVMFSNAFLMPCRMIRTWSTQWSTPPSSKSIATDRAQKGDSKPGHRPLQGGMTTKIVALTDALGNLVRFVLLPGQRFDTIGVPPLIAGIEFGALIADKAFDINSIIADLNERGAKIVISQHPRRTVPLQIDAEMYKWRHLIENFFCKLKEFKRIAMRADKTDQSFKAMIYLTAAIINSR